MDRITLINRARVRLGEAPLQTEADPGAEACIAIYDGLIAHFTSADIHWMKRTVQLVRVVDAPSQHWKYQYLLPGDRIGPPRAVYPQGDLRTPTTAYHLEQDVLHTDHETIWIAYMTLADPARWPGDFAECFTRALMAEFALSIREDRTLRDRLVAEVFGTPSEMGMGGMWGSVLTNHGQAEPATIVAGGFNPLIDVRF